MKTITLTLTLAAVSAVALATPLAAQGWQGDRAGAPTQSRSWNGDRQNVAQLRTQLDTGIARGTITRREAAPLRTELNALVRLETNYARGGFTRSESDTLRNRSASLQRMIQRAEGNGNRGAPRAGWSENRPMGSMGPVGNVGAGPGHRGDRFAGDLRVGQHFSSRQVALPAQYRSRYRDNDTSYYRYDADRVYQIDRVSGLIMAMFDVGN